MSVHERNVRGRVVSEHTCQFFDSEDTRAEAVAAFLSEGLRKGELVLVVARPVHWSAITERLTAAGVPVDRELERGRLVIKDAMDTLRRFSPHGAPDAALFRDIIGTAILGLSELGPLRVYGEMVDILAQRGEMAEALALESWWNDLAANAAFSLMCGYSAAHFVAPATHRALRDICLAHTDVRRGTGDALADWLLTAAHNSVGSSSSLSN